MIKSIVLSNIGFAVSDLWTHWLNASPHNNYAHNKYNYYKITNHIVNNSIQSVDGKVALA